MQAINLASAADGANVRTPVTSSAFDEQHRLFTARAVGPTAETSPLYNDRYEWSDALVCASRLYFPVSFLSLLLLATFVCLGQAFPYLSDGPWLKSSHGVLAIGFLLIQLTNRRYGPEYAFAQILLSLVVCDVIAAVHPNGIVELVSPAALPNAREVMAFVGAFVAAGYLSIAAFDIARGPRWWTAPLTSSYVSSLGFALLYYPLAYVGSDVPWYAHMSTHAGVLLAASVFGLIPYWLLRPIIRPLPGFGGY